jgi:hypothetical protein
MAQPKIGRNDPCACGSGKKSKKCCLDQRPKPKVISLPSGQRRKPTLPRGLTLREIDPNKPEHRAMIRVFTEKSQRAHFGPPELIRTPFNGWIMRTFGGTLTWSKPTETFHEFCVWVLKKTFGQEWLDEQFAQPVEDRHVVAKWLTELSELQKRDTPPGHKPGNIVSSIPTGGAQEVILLGRDLLYLAQLGKLPDRLIDRLRHKGEFQGAWYEVRIASALVHGGFDIEWLDKKSESHCEFTAKHSFTQEKFAVEAKSKRRLGLLNEPGEKAEDARVLATRNFRDALKKDADGLPLLVFIDVNMPLSDSFEDAAKLWAQHMADFIGPMGMSPSDPAKFAYAVCSNFSYHQKEGEPVLGLGVVYDKLPMFSVQPTKCFELTRHAVEEGLKQVGSLPPHTL